MGIVGFGRIGRHVAEIAAGNGNAASIAADTGRKDAPDWPGFRWCDVDELMSAADVVSLHCPLLPQTRGMINACIFVQDEAGLISNQHLAGTAR